ncbi:capsular polysaccharide synthesis protein [Acinetobacter pecorum]
MDNQELILIYNNLLKSKQKSPSPVTQNEDFKTALTAESKKNYDEALKLYEQCKKDFANDALLDLKIAGIYEKKNDKEKSRLIINHAIKNTLHANYDVEAAFKIHPSLLLERHLMAEFIIQNKSEIKEKIRENLSIKKINQNKAFVFWDNPATAPAVVKVALESQKKYIGEDFDLIILTKNNLSDYVRIPPHIEKLINSSPTHFSDWLRTELLTKYGGVWLDSTCLLTQDLSQSLQEIKKQNCFFFTYSGSRVGNWFIYSSPNSYVLNAIHTVLNLWWKNQESLTNYFMYHDIVEMLYWTDEEYKNEWDNMLKIHPRKALQLNQSLAKEFNLERFNEIINDFFIHKLTYKFDKKLYNTNSFVNYISDLPKINLSPDILENKLSEQKKQKYSWIFSSYNWQGNPKALFLYMSHKYQNSHECWWISENNEEFETLKKLGLNNILSAKDKRCKALFAECDVYITENFREKYPDNLPTTTKVINTWHGVGLKHIELALGPESILADSIVRKHIRNFKLYRNQSYFLATSPAMEDHFIQDTIIERSQIIRGPYPRNIVYGQVQSYDINQLINKSHYRNVILFAPTYRIKKINGVLSELIPSFDLLSAAIAENNDLLIIKVHPFMRNDPYFLEIQQQYSDSEHIMFWNENYDIYEIFHLIDIAIIDYSSIFYDLLEANVNKFIRYIPDYQEYSDTLGFIGDYFKFTSGVVSDSFEHLLQTLSQEIPLIENKDELLEYFFSYSKQKTLDQLIAEIDQLKTFAVQYKELHSFDVFDTLIHRKTLAPFSIFARMQQQLTHSELNFPQIFKDDWVQIRHKVEMDARDMFRKTTFERKTDQIEISLDLIYERLQNNYLLTAEQTDYLKILEIENEISHAEPMQHRIEFLLNLQAQGQDVILISDMYLPESVIRTMLHQADSRLDNIPLYLSSSTGYQKSTGKIYKHIFFEKKYQYEKWVHYGDNAHADGAVPRKFAIETRVHHIDSFIPFESRLIHSAPNSCKYEAYQLATLMHRYRQNKLSSDSSISNSEFEKSYYAYAYAGSLLVPYIHWTILDALERGYETLYFISRDGHYLKLIADALIEKNSYPIKTKYIYGSRKVWRLPSFIHTVDDEMFGPFGNFVGMDSFQDLVRASYLSEDELLALFPEFESLKQARHLRGETAENIRKTLSNSEIYRQKILALAAEKRVIVNQYLRENIDFSEKFAFVEFWGRGYTQDTFTRLLTDAAGHELTNPFYYIRSFSPETGSNLRHNFVLAPVNFSYFEPLFASTPYESISEYQRVNESVEAVIVPRLNDYHEFFQQGLIEFAEDYLKIETGEPASFARILNEHSYTYQMKESSDQFICNVFAKLEDNISSFGEMKEYAPVLSIQQLESVRDKKDLDQLTSSAAISLSRSHQDVRAYYQKIFQKMKLPAVNSTGIKYVYPTNNLENYIRAVEFPIRIVAIQRNSIYLDIGFRKDSKRQDQYLAQGEIFEVIAIEWLTNGIPRLVTQQGYVTAHRDWVLPLKEAEGIYVRKNALGEYEAIAQPITTKEKLNTMKNKHIEQLMSLLEKPYKILNKNGDFEHIQRKWGKFTRNPHQFFADAKNEKLILLKHCFDENTKVGKTLTGWIRRNL